MIKKQIGDFTLREIIKYCNKFPGDCSKCKIFKTTQEQCDLKFYDSDLDLDKEITI